MVVEVSVTPPRSAEHSMWQQVLKEYAPSKGEKKDTSLLVLGHPGCGARSIIARLQGQDPADSYKGIALEYDYLNIRNEGDEDSVGLMHVWHIESPAYSELLPLALTPERLSSTVIVIVVDLTTPHAIMDRLEEWYQKVEECVQELYDADPQLSKQLQQKVLSYLASYQARLRTEELKAKEQGQNVLLEEQPATAAPSLGPGMLLNNLGIPLIVVGAKADQMEAVVTRDSAALLGSQMPNSAHSQEILHFVQVHLRKWCLANGGTLIYTSAHTNLNVPLLLHYITHRAYGFAFPKEKSLNKPDVVFAPWGSDSLAEMGKLSVEGITSNGLDASYNVVLKSPVMQHELQAPNHTPSTNHQQFLTKQLELVRRYERDGHMLKLPSTPAKPAGGTVGLKKATKELLSPKSGKKVEQDAEKFFASMLKSYKK